MAKNRVLGFLMIILILFLLAYFYPFIQEKLGITGKTIIHQDYSGEQGILLRVIDGDTIEARVKGYEEIWKIRLLGINNIEV